MKRDSSSTSSYNYRRALSAAKQDSHYVDFAEYIDSKIHKYQNNIGERFTKKDLARITGISYEMLKKIITRSKITRKTDCIIAICVALKLDLSETNLALDLYKMPRLNPHNQRDLVIIQALAYHEEIDRLNQILQEYGFSPLNTNKSGIHRSKDDECFYSSTDSKYKVLECQITPYNIAGDDAEITLSSRYLPYNFSYNAFMILETDTGEKIKISTDGFRFLYRTNEDGEFIPDKRFKSNDIIEDSDLRQRFLELEYAIDTKARQLIDLCNDTRNYHVRIGAEVISNELVLYGETFNYESPELNEYYQFEFKSGNQNFYVSTSSRFMYRYLPHKTYKEFYGIAPALPFCEYCSLLTIENKIREEPNFYKKNVLKRYLHYFEFLTTAANKTLHQLINRELLVYNPRLSMDTDDLLDFFKVKDKFYKIPYDDTSINEKKPLINSFVTPDGNEISIMDLYRAGELGIDSIDDICIIRKKYGSLEKILKL